MAENNEDRQTDDLSDEPSPYRIQKFRQEGRVAQSRELSGLIGLMAAGLTIYLMSPTIGAQIVEFMRDVFRTDIATKMNFTDKGVLFQLLGKLAKVVAYLAAPIGVIAFVFGFLGSYIQIGSIFSTKPITPDLNKINPVNGVKRFFSLRQVYDGLRLVVRASAVALVAFFLVKAEVIHSPIYILSDPNSLLGAFGGTSKAIFAALCIVLLIFAGFDLWIQRWEYGKQVRTTKKEAKEEHKEHEGDPMVKARIRTIQRDAARKRMMEGVKKADVVVTNPTHIAIALKYDTEKMDAPKVIAKGADYLAQRIKKIARDNNVPTVENVPLARTLYKVVKVGQSIPRNLYKAVAEVLAYIYRLKDGRRRYK